MICRTEPQQSQPTKYCNYANAIGARRVQRSAKFLFPCCVYFCLALPGWCLAKQKTFLADLCRSVVMKENAPLQLFGGSLFPFILMWVSMKAHSSIIVIEWRTERRERRRVCNLRGLPPRLQNDGIIGTRIIQLLELLWFRFYWSRNQIQSFLVPYLE